VHGWKERGLRRAADLAAELVTAHVERPAADAITHIPPDSARQLERGRHPAEALARGLALHWDLEHVRLVRRTTSVARQAALPRDERRRNVRGAFAPATASPAHVVLVDDVYTTGSTATAATGALLSGGASVVDVVTFARAVR